jgi:hypothetical protein
MRCASDRTSRCSTRRHQRDHLDGLRVVADHPLHEFDVRADELHLRQVDGFDGADHLSRLTGRTRLDDRRRLVDGRT